MTDAFAVRRIGVGRTARTCGTWTPRLEVLRGGALTALVLAAVFGCGPDTESVDASVCASETRWIGDESGSPRMHPGRDCMDCHAREDGPSFVFAGTVFSERDADDDCFGLEGVEVRITGADGQVFAVETNEAGNFFREGKKDSLERPFVASIMYDGVETQMMTAQTESSCGSCHTREGKNAAPGRISPEQLLASPPSMPVDGGTSPAADSGAN